MSLTNQKTVPMLLLGICTLWAATAAAQQSVLGQPVTAVPRLEPAPAEQYPGLASGNDDTKPAAPSSRETGSGPSEAFLEEEEAGRRD